MPFSSYSVQLAASSEAETGEGYFSPWGGAVERDCRTHRYSPSARPTPPRGPQTRLGRGSWTTTKLRLRAATRRLLRYCGEHRARSQAAAGPARPGVRRSAGSGSRRGGKGASARAGGADSDVDAEMSQSPDAEGPRQLHAAHREFPGSLGDALGLVHAELLRRLGRQSYAAQWWARVWLTESPRQV